MPDEYCVIMTTVAATSDAERLAALLLERRLAACVQCLPITSFYVFEGERCHEPEVLLLVKTRAALYAQIEALLRDEHPYKVPELVMTPVIRGLAPYLAWIDDSTDAGT